MVLGEFLWRKDEIKYLCIPDLHKFATDDRWNGGVETVSAIKGRIESIRTVGMHNKVIYKCVSFLEQRGLQI